MSDELLTKETKLSDVVKEAAYKIHMAGGCEAVDDYSRGYDDAIAVAPNILLEESGFEMEDVLDYGEHGEI